jgi:chitodextrinase
VTGLVAGTTYLAQVTAVDTSGNESLCSNLASVPAKADAPDTTAPTVTALTANKTAPRPARTPITFTASATGGSESYESRWYLWNEANWTLLRDWQAGLSYTWTPRQANASYIIAVNVRNAGGTWDSVRQASVAFHITKR